MDTNSEPVRRYDFDGLRGIGALCVVAAHCATLFTTWSTGLSGLPPNAWIGAVAWLLNPWLMPLFMVLAGASMWYALKRRSLLGFVRDRAIRLSVPVAAAVFLIVPVMSYLGCVYNGEFEGSFLQFYPYFFSAVHPTGEFSFLHFWFLVYLLLYTFMALPVFAYLRGASGEQLMARLAGIAERRGGLYVLAVPLLAVQLALGAGWPQPDLPVLVNDWARFVLFFGLFVYGYILMAEPRFSRAIAGQWQIAGFMVGLTSTLLLTVVLSDGFNPFRDLPRTFGLAYVAYHAVSVLCTWSWVVFLLGAGQRYLNTRHAPIAYTGAASYGIYLLHPFIWPLAGLWVKTWDMAPLLSFAGLFVCVLLGTLALYEIVRRCHPVALVLGIKPAETGLRATALQLLHNASLAHARAQAHVVAAAQPAPVHARIAK